MQIARNNVVHVHLLPSSLILKSLLQHLKFVVSFSGLKSASWSLKRKRLSHSAVTENDAKCRNIKSEKLKSWCGPQVEAVTTCLTLALH